MQVVCGQIGRSTWWWTIRLVDYSRLASDKADQGLWAISPGELLLSRLPKIGEDYWCWVSAMGMGLDLKMKCRWEAAMAFWWFG